MEIKNYEGKYQRECRDCLLSAWSNLNLETLIPKYISEYIIKHTNAIILKTTYNKIAIINSNGIEKVVGLIYCKIVDNKYPFINPYVKIISTTNKIYIKHLAVLPEYQGKGIATSLLNDVKKYAYDNNIKYIWLFVEDFNKNAKIFYEKYGFINKGVVEIVKNKEYSNLYELEL